MKPDVRVPLEAISDAGADGLRVPQQLSRQTALALQRAGLVDFIVTGMTPRGSSGRAYLTAVGRQRLATEAARKGAK